MPNFLLLPAVICARQVSDIRDISEQLLHTTWPELKPRNNLVLEKPTILVAEDLTLTSF